MPKPQRAKIADDQPLVERSHPAERLVSPPAPVRIEQPEQVQNHTSAFSHKDTKTPTRIARGYKFREDLIKQCKQIALDDGKKLYEVMEEALEEYIARKRIEK